MLTVPGRVNGEPTVVSRLEASLREWWLSMAERLASGESWRARVLVFSIALSYLMAFPSFDVIRTGEFTRTWSALEQQFSQPFTPRPYPPGSHEAKTALRLTVPVAAHVIGFHAGGALVLQFLSGVAVLALTIALTFRITGDRVAAALCAIAVATTFPGIAAFSDDYRGMFDGVAYALLLAALWSRAPWTVFACVFLAAYTDERALLGSTLIIPWWWLRSADGHRDPSAPRPRRLPHQITAVIAAWIVYAATRAWLQIRFGLSTPIGSDVGVGLSVFEKQLSGVPFGVWTGLEALWIPVVVAMAVLVFVRRWTLAAVVAAGTAVTLIAANSVSDVTRSAAYVFPVFFVSLQVLATYDTPKRLRSLLTATSALAVMIPTYYTGLNEIRWFLPAPLQLLRMALHGAP